jgi:hypothetical protein
MVVLMLLIGPKAIGHHTARGRPADNPYAHSAA